MLPVVCGTNVGFATRLIDLDIQWQLNRQVMAPVLAKGATHLETMGSPVSLTRTLLWLPAASSAGDDLRAGAQPP